MTHADRLEPLVAVRLLSTKLLAKKLSPPAGGWTNRNVLVATARLGGFLARKGDGMPG